MESQSEIMNRFEAINSQVRWLKRGLVAALGLPAFALLMGQGAASHAPAEVQEVIKAKQFSLVDDEGSCRATLGFGPGVMVHGQSQVGFEQVVLSLNAKHGEHAVELRAMHDGTPAIRLLGSDGKGRLAMRLQRDDSPNVWLIDEKGVDRVKIAFEPGGNPNIVLKNATGEETLFKP